MKRVILFLATNIAVLLLISIIFQAFGLERMFAEQGVGINFEALLIFSALFGMGGAFISLLLSKKIAKWTLKLRIIERPGDAEETWLLETVRRQAQQAGIGMPEVGIYEGPEMNAFATGARRDAALVAVSRGLLQRMSRDEVEAVLGHEVSHVANGDMITMALIQGVLNTFVIFLSRVIGYVVDKLVLKNERGFGIGYFVTVIAAQILLGILAAMIVNWFSRQREFRADAGGARLAGREKMIAALERLGGNQDSQLPDQMKAFGISGHVGRGFKRLFMSHPPIPERVQALRDATSF